MIVPGTLFTVSGVLETVAAFAPLVNVTCTDDASAGVPEAITTMTDVALTYVHVVAVPELGVAPTLAVHAASMKLEPVIVMVPPM